MPSGARPHAGRRYRKDPMNHAQQLINQHQVPVILYSKKPCVQCDAMVRKLTKEGAPFHKVDVTQDPAAYEFVTSLNYAQVPVTYTSGGEHWGGYVPANVEALIPKEVAA
jgi:glutaredoxin-like protein NrdH